MGIPLKTNKRRRSYGNYKPPNNNPNRFDPFLLILVIGLVVFIGWLVFNRDTARAFILERLGQVTEVQADAGEQPANPGIGGGDGTSPDQPATAAPDLSAEQLATEAVEAYNIGNVNEAIDLYQQASQQNPSEGSYAVEAARLLVYQSALYYGERRDAMLEEALTAARRAQNAEPESPDGFAIEGKVLDWQGLPEDGRNQVTRALSFDPNYALAHSYLAEILIDLDLPEQADESIQTALALTPQGNVDVLRDFAYVLENQQRYNDAITQYEQAIALNPRLPYLRVALARNYRVFEQCNDALEQLQAAQSQARDSAIVAFEIGLTYEACLGDFPGAVEAYQQAISVDDGYLFPYLRLATIQYFNGQYAQAIPNYERAIELGAPESGGSELALSYQLGYAYAAEGQCSDALPYLTTAQELAGEDNDVILDVVLDGIEICESTPEGDIVPTLTPTPDA